MSEPQSNDNLHAYDYKHVKPSLYSNDKSDIISLISKEADKNISEREIKVDVPFEEWGEGESINIYIYIYITGHRVVNNTFHRLICNGEVYNNDVKSCETMASLNLLTRIRIKSFTSQIITC